MESGRPARTPPAAQVAGQGLEIKSKEQHLEKKSSSLDSSVASHRKPLDPPPWVGLCVRARAGFWEAAWSGRLRGDVKSPAGLRRWSPLSPAARGPALHARRDGTAGEFRDARQGLVAAKRSDKGLVELEFEGSRKVTGHGIALPGGVLAPR